MHTLGSDPAASRGRMTPDFPCILQGSCAPALFTILALGAARGRIEAVPGEEAEARSWGSSSTRKEACWAKISSKRASPGNGTRTPAPPRGRARRRARGWGRIRGRGGRRQRPGRRRGSGRRRCGARRVGAERGRLGEEGDGEGGGGGCGEERSAWEGDGEGRRWCAERNGCSGEEGEVGRRRGVAGEGKMATAAAWGSGLDKYGFF
ncbi:unnamed protein product [Urochloa humidicola]